MESQCSNCSQTARVKCMCRESETLLCVNCLETHVLIQARHVIKEISDRKDPSCSACKSPMEMICICQDSKTRLCHKCLITHMVSNPTITHSIEPLIADSLTDGQDLQAYIKKKNIIDLLIAEAYSNFSLLEKYKQKIVKTKEIIIESLEKTVQEAFTKADSIKGQIEKIINFLESKKFSQNASEDWADHLINKCTLENISIYSKTLKFFIADVNKDSILTAMKNFADIKIIKNPIKATPTAYYIKPKPKEIFFVDLETLNVNKVPLPAGLQLKEMGGWCEISTGCLVYCGGKENNQYFNDFFQIELADSTFKRLPNMNESRIYPSVHFINNLVFVFGGYQGQISLKSCEKFDLNTSTWKKLPEMNYSRSGFSSVVSNNKIYIAGDCKIVEVFNVSNETFEVLPCKLEISVNFSTIFSANNKIYLLQKDRCLECYEEKEEIKFIKNLPVGNWWSQFSPIPFKGQIYFARFDDHSFWKAGGETFEFKKLLKF